MLTKPGAAGTPPEDVVLPTPGVNGLVDPDGLRIGDGAEDDGQPDEIDAEFGAGYFPRELPELGDDEPADDDEPELDEGKPEPDGPAHATPCPVATARPTPKPPPTRIRLTAVINNT